MVRSSLINSVNKALPIEKLLTLLGYDYSLGWMSCVLHADSRPSLRVYGGDRGWYCYECNKGGSSVEFYARLNKITFEKAAEILARKYALKNKKITLDFLDRKAYIARRARGLKHSIIGLERLICKRYLTKIREEKNKALAKVLYDGWYSYGISFLNRLFCFHSLAEAELQVVYLDSYFTFLEETWHDVRRHRRTR